MSSVLTFGGSVLIFGAEVLISGAEPAAADTTAPTITSASSTSVNENSNLAFSLTADETVTWSIVSGTDQAQCEISGSTLRWAGNGTKNYEAPTDADANNVYVVTVRATDASSNTSDQTISVTVLDVADTPPVSTHDGGDGISKKELEDLRRRMKAAEQAGAKKRKQAEQRLNDAVNAAWTKLYGPRAPKPAPAAPKPVISEPLAVKAPEDRTSVEIAKLKASINEAMILIGRAQEMQRLKDIREQEDEDEAMFLLLS